MSKSLKKKDIIRSNLNSDRDTAFFKVNPGCYAYARLPAPEDLDATGLKSFEGVAFILVVRDPDNPWSQLRIASTNTAIAHIPTNLISLNTPLPMTPSECNQLWGRIRANCEHPDAEDSADIVGAIALLTKSHTPGLDYHHCKICNSSFEQKWQKIDNDRRRKEAEARRAANRAKGSKGKKQKEVEEKFIFEYDGETFEYEPTDVQTVENESAHDFEEDF